MISGMPQLSLSDLKLASWSNDDQTIRERDSAKPRRELFRLGHFSLCMYVQRLRFRPLVHTQNIASSKGSFPFRICDDDRQRRRIRYQCHNAQDVHTQPFSNLWIFSAAERVCGSQLSPRQSERMYTKNENVARSPVQ